MGWLDNIEGKLDDALDDVKEEIGERLEQAGVSLFGNGNEGLGGGKITLTVDGLPLEPYALTADSFLSQISEYQFYCAVAVGVEAGSFLDKPAQWSCTSADGLSRDYAGKVTRIDQGRILPDGQEEWVLTVSSGLAALRQQSRYRIVHRRTVIELAEELLQEYGLTVDNRTHEHYPPMDWTAQVGETDLQFLQRLLARDGIWFYSTLAEQGEVIVLADDQHGASRADRGELAVTAETGGSRSVAGHATVALRQSRRYYRWQPDRSRVHQQVCPSEAAALTRESQSSAGKVATRQTFFQSGSGDAHASLTQARLEQERQQCRSHTILVSGAVGDLQAGQWLPVAGHGPCLITRAAITFSSPRNHLGNSPNGFTWEAELLPLAQPFRPALPAQISLPLLFPARVEAGGPYSHVDGMANRKARIDFDDGDQPLTESSPPLRQLQPHGSLPGKDGQATGWDWPLRNGAEVLLTCLNNDPEKPLILGYAPAASQPGPVSNRNVPENRILTPAGHLLNFNDRKEAQAITLNTPDGQCLLDLSANSESPLVTLACEQGALVMRAGQHQNIDVGKNSQIRIGSDSTTQVLNRFVTHTDSGVIHHQSQTSTHLTATDNAALESGKNLELYSAANSQLRVQGSAAITASKGLASKVGGNLQLQATDVIDIRGDGSGDLTLHQGGGGITIKGNGTVRLFGNTVTLKGQSGVTFNGNKEYSVPAGVKADSPMPEVPKAPEAIVAIETEAQSVSQGDLVELCYVPAEQCFYGLTAEEMEQLDEEERILAKPMQSLLQAKQSRDKDAIASAQDKVAEEIKPVINGASVDGLTEIVRLRGKKYTYVRSDKMKNHVRSYKLDADDRKRRALRDKDGNYDLEKVKKQLSQVTGKVTWGLGKAETSGAFTEWARSINKNAKAGTDNLDDPLRTYDATAQAQLMRYYAGASGAINFNPQKGQFGIEGQVSGSLALAEGKVTANGYFPHADGHHIVFDHEDAKDGKPVQLGKVRAHFEMSLAGFAGASAMACGKLEFQHRGGGLMFKGADAGGRLSGEVFAGAKVECQAKGALEWANPDENYQFKLIADVGYGLAGQAGIGAAGGFTLSYEDGRFMLRAKAGIVCGIGAKGELSYTVQVDHITTFVAFSYHSLRDADYSTGMIMEEAAEEAMAALMYFAYWKGKKTYEDVKAVYEDALDMVKAIREWNNRAKSALPGVLDKLSDFLKHSHLAPYAPPLLQGYWLWLLRQGGERAVQDQDVNRQLQINEGMTILQNRLQDQREWQLVVYHAQANSQSGPVDLDNPAVQQQIANNERPLHRLIHSSLQFASSQYAWRQREGIEHIAQNDLPLTERMV